MKVPWVLCDHQQAEVGAIVQAEVRVEVGVAFLGAVPVAAPDGQHRSGNNAKWS